MVERLPRSAARRCIAPLLASNCLPVIRRPSAAEDQHSLAFSAFHGVLRRRRNTWPSAVEVKISGLDVVEGSVRIYVRSMAGGPGRGLSGANDDDSVVVAVVGWHRGWLVGVLCWRRRS